MSATPKAKTRLPLKRGTMSKKEERRQPEAKKGENAAKDSCNTAKVASKLHTPVPRLIDVPKPSTFRWQIFN